VSHGNSFRKTSNIPKPVVQIGQEYTVDITDTGRAGDGIARIQGFVIFVRNAKVGGNIRSRLFQLGVDLLMQ
jgi:predicted RNA-binding protein with TRAM domain